MPIIFVIICIDMLVVRLAPCHYLNQCWHTLTWTNFSGVHIKMLTTFFYSRKAFGNIVCKATAILSQHKFVRLWKSHMICEHPILIITKINIDMSHPSMKMFTHLPMDKIASVPQTIFSNAFSWMKNFVFLVLISLTFVPKGPIDNKSTLV